VALTQYALRYLIITPTFIAHHSSPILNSLQFFLLVLCTLIVAAGGYIINDHYDIEIDRINKIESQILGKTISASKALPIYFSSLILGGAIAILLAYQLNLWNLIFIYPLACGLLYFYARYFKKVALIGNLIVSLFTAFVVLIVFISELPIISQLPDESQTYLLQLGFGFTIFSFLSNLFRELIKDIEDMKGDKLFGAKTAPIVFGIKWTKFICNIVLVLLFSYILYFINQTAITKYANQHIWLGSVLCLPIMLLLFKLFKASNKLDFTSISKLSKVYMLLGIMALFSLIKYPIIL
jgi:4-hydroxybenzoate polyprenyltransferase